MAFRHTRDMKLKCRHLLAGTGFAALLCGASAAIAQPPSLGGADSFVILAGSRVTNTGPTHVTGSIGPVVFALAYLAIRKDAMTSLQNLKKAVEAKAATGGTV